MPIAESAISTLQSAIHHVVMRKLLLAGSTNPWLRERATKTAFVRRSVSRFMPGEQIDDALRAARS